MKKTVIFILTFLTVCCNFAVFTFWLDGFWSSSSITTSDATKVIIGVSEDNPIREWMQRPIEYETGKIENVIDYDWNVFERHRDAIESTMKVIQSIVNYALGLLAIIALVYLIYHGFLVLTAGGDDAKVKKWQKWIKTAAIALIWIGLSWSIVSLILWFITLLMET